MGTYMINKLKRYFSDGINPLFYIGLIFVCLNFLGKGSVVLLAFCLIILAMNAHRVKIDFIGALLIIFGLFGFVKSLIFSYGINEGIKYFNYPLIYISGNVLIRKTIARDKFIKNLGFALFVGFTLHIFLDYLLTRKIGFSEYYRVFYSFWTQETVAVTLIGLLCSPIIAYSFYGIFLSRKPLIILGCIASLALVIYINLLTATRTPIVLMVVVFIVMFLIYFLKSKSRNKLKFLLGVIALFAIAIIMYIFDVFSIKTTITNSSLFARIEREGLSTSRSQITLFYLNNMFAYPFGGSYIHDLYGQSAHNYIQQIQDLIGIIPMVIIIIVSVCGILSVFKLLKS